ncbi:TauD/TfdA family dioxygenase [Paeniroseomonas aquatica]|uniref:TauD/TfdA family dioxygenase n=1 Tax=Paeniroseomonas aquatica TaxID=373043 RepID=A0ABT8A5X2_9PROT|nr:TauD/TfdA family dioxygenase [Paeniroseomonas aquatica]MDN3565090.1 TauD/TfdA family dioxygenase [Paeniroseomonas aquatica]
MIQPVATAAAWRARDLESSGRWLRRLTAPEIADLRAGFARLKAGGKPMLEITRDDMPLGAFAAVLAEAATELEAGCGLRTLRGLPVGEYSVEDARLLFWGIGTHLGVARPQGKASQLMSDVRDAGGTYRGAGGRGYNTNAELDFHTDGSDVVGLLCLRTAQSGGLSRVASSVAIHDALLAERPELVETLYGPFPHSRQKEEAADETPTYLAPVYSLAEGRFASRYIRNHIRSTQLIEGEPRLTEIQHAALDAIQALASSDEFCFSMWLEPGDLQLVNNHVAIHSRTHYQDFEEPELKRHLLRLWLAVPQGRPLCDGLAGVYKSAAPGTVRGGFKGQGVTPAMMAWQARAAAALGMRDTPY